MKERQKVNLLACAYSIGQALNQIRHAKRDISRMPILMGKEFLKLKRIMAVLNGIKKKADRLRNQ